MTEKDTWNFSVTVPENSDQIIRVIPGRKRKDLKGMSFAFIFLELFEKIATDNDLTLTDTKVLNGLLCHLDFGNEMNVSQSELEKELKIRQPHIAKAIKRLIEREYIMISRTKGRRNIYSLSPHLGIRGTPSNKKMLDRAWNERQKNSEEQEAIS